MSTTTTISFSVIDYKGTDTLSSYCTPITPLRLVPDLPTSGFNTRIVWDFGDGTTSKSFSAIKNYEKPGIYHINLVIYDCDTNAQVSTYEREVTIFDFIKDTFTIETPPISSWNIDEIGELEWLVKCGKIDGPFIFKSYCPFHETPSSIFYSVSGSNSLNWWDIEENKFAHLQNFYCLYETKYNYGNKLCYFKEIDKIDFDYSPIYGKVENGEIVYSLLSSSNSSIIGYSSEKKVYFKDDTLSDKIVLSFWKDKRSKPFSNNMKISIRGGVIPNDEISKLSITSNGLDGEGFPINSFNISPVKFFDSSIPFVIKVKDGENFSVKDFSNLPLSSFNIRVFSSGTPLLSNIHYTLSSLNPTLSSQTHNGSFRGLIRFPKLSSNLLSSVTLSVSANLRTSLSAQYSLSGVSNNFNVYSKDYYDIWKMGEDFNPVQTLKDITLQETLLNNDVLYDDFFGSVLGNENSDHDAIGLKLYEKIKNYLKNTKDVDVCEKDFLDGLGQMVNFSQNGENYQLPLKVKRILDLASISRGNLIGETNKFRENFDTRGITTKEIYGKNIGNMINPMTYTVLSSQPIVALEKFSGKYTLLNTYQPLSGTYALSAYSSDWGWPLVLPSNFNFRDIGKYYLFFEYVFQYDDTVVDSVVDYSNQKTTIGRDLTDTQLFSEGGVFDIMILDSLYQSLSV